MDLAGSSAKTVRHLERLGHYPRDTRKPRLKTLQAKLLKHLPQYLRGGEGPLNPVHQLKELQARKALQEQSVAEGKLVPRDELTRELVKRVRVLKRSMLRLPEKLAPQVAGMETREAYALLKTELENLIRRYAGQEVKP